MCGEDDEYSVDEEEAECQNELLIGNLQTLLIRILDSHEDTRAEPNEKSIPKLTLISAASLMTAVETVLAAFL
jgi:hypothetical protein